MRRSAAIRNKAPGMAIRDFEPSPARFQVFDRFGGEVLRVRRATASGTRSAKTAGAIRPGSSGALSAVAPKKTPRSASVRGVYVGGEANWAADDVSHTGLTPNLCARG
jgi:hypothetical protein